MNITTFNFNSVTISTLTDEQGNPWFIASEICGALEHSDTSKAVSRLDLDEKLLRTMFVSGQNREVLTINESGLYSLILTSRKPEAKAFKKWITSEVLPSIRKSGQYSVQPSRIPLDEITRSLEVANNMLNICPSGKLRSLRRLYENYGIQTDILPDYTIDAPTISAGSSVPTISITEVIKRAGLRISAMAANSRLESLGLIKQEYRPSTRGNGIKKYWTITPKGLQYGKNLTSDKNPRETSVHWYVTSIESLAKLLG